MIIVHLSTPFVVMYWLGFGICWRMLTGHFAWAWHRSAKTQPTVRPPVENWLGAAVCSLPLSLIWFVVLWFTMPWPWLRGAEREEEAHLGRARVERITLENQHNERLLGLGEDDE